MPVSRNKSYRFSLRGIDFCCGGRKPLEQACNELQLSLEQVLEKLLEAEGEPAAKNSPDWQSATLAKLIQHIVRKHHAFVRQELPRLDVMSEKVQTRHVEAHPELARVRSLVKELSQELLAHMMKEEQPVVGQTHLRRKKLRATDKKPQTNTASKSFATYLPFNTTCTEDLQKLRRSP